MKYANFKEAQLLSTQIENIKYKIQELQSALARPQNYFLSIRGKSPNMEPVDFFTEDCGEYVREVASRYLAQLEVELQRKIREFEDL